METGYEQFASLIMGDSALLDQRYRRQKGLDGVRVIARCRVGDSPELLLLHATERTGES